MVGLIWEIDCLLFDPAAGVFEGVKEVMFPCVQVGVICRAVSE